VLAEGWRCSVSLVQRIEAQLASQPLAYGPRDPRVEAMRFPAMVRLFKELASVNGWMPPTQHEFCLFVALRVGLEDGLADAIRGRAGRAYISLVVQLHAFAALKDRFPVVLWDDVLDMKHGVDLLVIDTDGAVAGLALMCPTDTSLRQAERKNGHGHAVPFAVRRLVVQERHYMAGDYWLYEPSLLIVAVDETLNEQRRRTA
jgi:hypothetical protein